MAPTVARDIPCEPAYGTSVDDGACGDSGAMSMAYGERGMA